MIYQKFWLNQFQHNRLIQLTSYLGVVQSIMYHISDITEEDEEILNSPSEVEESAEVLISKNLLPPARDPLPRAENNHPNSLLPMLTLPPFVGIVPQHQPLLAAAEGEQIVQNNKTIWIGQAFDNIVYKRYPQQSYTVTQGRQQKWNVWTCDVSVVGERSDSKGERQNLSPYYILKSITDTTLVFESRFESGNLSIASKISQFEYNLLLQNDINTCGYTQWFFFRVSNTKNNSKIKFNILNMYKNNSLYRQGMQITIYSTKKSEFSNLSWHKAGEDIDYFENIYIRHPQNPKRYHTLTWTYQFQYDQDQVYFAYNYPYTYSNLNTTLRKIELDNQYNKFFKRGLLCRTFAGNRVDVLTITEKDEGKQKKKVIVISARIHPGETISSFVFEGILKFLLTPQAAILRKTFIFKMIPMINPDGVIHGNYRTNLSGKDMNRHWEQPSKLLIPQVFHFKKLVLDLHQENGIILFCDLHGHSKKKNAFVYGCHNFKYPFHGKQFPFLVSKLFPGFSFKCCSFIKKQIREGSARSVLSRQLKIPDVFTLENSFCGPSYENIHFTVKHFTQLGYHFCKALILYFRPTIKQRHIQIILKANRCFFSEDNLNQDEDQRFNHLDELYKNKSMLLQRVNSENSQGSEQQIQSQNLLSENSTKRYYQQGDIPVVKKNSVSVLSKSPSKSTKIRLNVQKRNYQSAQSQRYSSASTLRLTKSRFNIRESKRGEGFKRKESSKKIQVLKKIQPKLFEAHQFFTLNPQAKNFQKPTINHLQTNKIKPLHQSHSPKKQSYQRKSIQLNAAFITNQTGLMNLLKNNYLSVLLACSPPPLEEPLLREILQPKELFLQKSSSEFRVRRKSYCNSDKLRFAEDFLDQANTYKKVMASLKSTKKK